MEVVVEASMGAIYRSINGGAMDFRHHNVAIASIRIVDNCRYRLFIERTGDAECQMFLIIL